MVYYSTLAPPVESKRQPESERKLLQNRQRQQREAIDRLEEQVLAPIPPPRVALQSEEREEGIEERYMHGL